MTIMPMKETAAPTACQAPIGSPSTKKASTMVMIGMSEMIRPQLMTSV